MLYGIGLMLVIVSGADPDSAATGTTVPGDRASAGISFTNDVLPVLSKAGCNQGTCHGSAAGKGGFKLSLRGFAPELDYPAIVRNEAGRRIDRLRPENSLILRKPTLATPHQGGRVLPPGSAGYHVLLEWLRQGAAGPADDAPRLMQIAVTPDARSLDPNEQITLHVSARFSDGSERDVTEWARFDTNDVMVASVTAAGLVRAGVPGQTAVSAAYQDRVAAAEITVPYPAPAAARNYAELVRANYIDDLVIDQWQRLRLWPSPPADDATFLRRLYLDLTGTLPEPAAVRAFLADRDPRKRDAVIDRLLDSTEYVDLWTQKWSDVFRVSREWITEKGMWTFHNYLRDRIGRNVPWDQTVRELVAGVGDSRREGPPNFYLLQKVLNEADLWPLTAAETVAQTFLGVRIQCARCHNHPLDRWTQADYYGMANFFARVGAKTTPEGVAASGVLFDAPTGDINHPRLGRPVPPTPLGGPAIQETASRVWDGASWVWDSPGAATQDLSIDQSREPRYLRRVFELSAAPAAARLHITVDDAYVLYVNGREVGRDAAWNPPKSYDVTRQLVAGKNLIAVQATNVKGPGGAIAWLHVVTPDGRTTTLGSDASWQIATQVGDDWFTADGAVRGNWRPATVLGPADTPPWALARTPLQALASGPPASRREQLAHWITAPDNPYFARATANRVWRHFMGRGLVEPVDDFRSSNPPSNRPLLDTLARDLVEHRFDLKHLMRTVLRSNAYQLSSVATDANRGDSHFFSHYALKRMTAEQLLDALGQVTGQAEKLPGLPAGFRAQQLPDTKFASTFLDTFGRPLRRVASCECERVQEPNLGQALELMHSRELHARVTADDGLVARLLQAGTSDSIIVEEIYLRCLARPPTGAETAAILTELRGQTDGSPAADGLARRREFFEDLLWAIVNSKEFLFNH